MSYHLCTYLLKENEYTSFDTIIRRKVKFEKYIIDSGDLNGCVIYKGLNEPHKPVWLPLLEEIKLGNFFNGLVNTSTKLILAIKVEGRVFCVVFGHGRFMIKDELIERNFGIRVVLNSVLAENIRAVDTRRIENKSVASRTQTSTLTHINNFSAKDFGNFLMGITGKSKFEELGKTVTGTDAFSFSYKYKINDLPNVLKFIYNKYNSDDYQKDFEFFDRMHFVKDKPLVEKLDMKLLNRINKRQLNLNYSSELI
jgi:uncharacterized protein (TIGR04141 family)